MPINLLDYPHAHTHRWIHTDADIPCMHISVRPHKSTQIYEKWTHAAIVNSTFSYLLFSHTLTLVFQINAQCNTYLLQYLPPDAYTQVKSWPSFVRGECMSFLWFIQCVSLFLGKGLGECIGNRRISQFKLHATGALALGGGFSSCELKLSLTLILAFLQHRCAAQPAQTSQRDGDIVTQISPSG